MHGPRELQVETAAHLLLLFVSVGKKKSPLMTYSDIILMISLLESLSLCTMFNVEHQYISQ